MLVVVISGSTPVRVAAVFNSEALMIRPTGSMKPLMPEEFTVGGLDPRTLFGDVVRRRMIGLGFDEAIGNILSAERDLRRRLIGDPTVTDELDALAKGDPAAAAGTEPEQKDTTAWVTKAAIADADANRTTSAPLRWLWQRAEKEWVDLAEDIGADDTDADDGP